MNWVDGTAARVVSRDADDDTIELELSESVMQAFAEAAALAEGGSPAEAASDGPAGAGPSLWFAPTGVQAAPASNQAIPIGTQEASADGHAATTQRPTATPVYAATRGLPKNRPRFAVALATSAAAAALLGGVTYLATARPSRPIAAVPVAAAVKNVGGAAVAPEIPPPDEATDAPVQFKNPFDASEVFEFPPGTTPIQARDAVAELLSQRAQERLGRGR